MYALYILKRALYRPRTSKYLHQKIQTKKKIRLLRIKISSKAELTTNATKVDRLKRGRPHDY